MKDSKATTAYWMDLVIPGGDPLSRQERDKLNKFINVRSGPGRPVSFSMLDGFLTALVIGPTMAPRDQSQSLEVIWGEAPNATGLNTRSKKVQHQMMNALGRHADHMLNCIQSKRDSYQPYASQDIDDWSDIDDLDDDDCGDAEGLCNSPIYTPCVVEWCEGFMKYVALSPESWSPIFKAEANRSSMAPFIYFGSDGGWNERKELVSGLRPYRLHFAKHMKYFVFEVNDFFRPPPWKVEMSSLMKLVAPQWSTPTNAKQLK
jgi:hypothetical protein